MLLPETKEREYRFKLALRMVLPIFTLVFAFILHTFISSNESLSTSFYIESILILSISIYFIFYLIYKGFDTKITDSVSKVFTREYLYKCLKKDITNNKEYTLLLISIENLDDINERYGIRSGDKILLEIARWIGRYFKQKDIINFPLGHVKGGDFVIGLKGSKIEYKSIIELMFLKADELKIDDIEIQISGAINDTKLSSDLNYLIENLFQLQSQNKDKKLVANIDDEMNPSELESLVINAIKTRNVSIELQDVFFTNEVYIKECFTKLKLQDNKLLHQKTYMKVLDKFRLMLDYDLIVLEENIKKCTDLNNNIFAFSVSATSLRNHIFINKAKELFNNNQYAKNRIIILLSENEYYPRTYKFKEVIKTLKDLGIKIAVDRLGSIHTSFLYLRDLDIDIVRFDRFYTKDIGKNKSIIEGFNTMAHNKGVKTWIKMVENEEQYNISKELNIDYIQGKYLAPLENR